MDLWVVGTGVDKLELVVGNFVQEGSCSHILGEADNDAGSSHFVEEVDSFLEVSDILHCTHKADNSSLEEVEARNSAY